MQKIKAVLFDFGGVLANEGFQNYISSHVAPYQAIENEISDLENSVNKGDLPVSAYDDFFAVMTNGNPDDIDKDLLAEYVLRKDMLQIVRSLRINTIKTAILSNFPDEWFAKLRQKFHLDNFFDEIFVSSKMHLIKPQEEFFQEALKKLTVLPQETIFIDDRASYVDAAEKLGIHGIVFTSTEQLKKDLQTLGIQV